MELEQTVEHLKKEFGLTGIMTDAYLVKPDGMLSLFFINGFKGDWNKSYDYDTKENLVRTFEYKDDPSWSWGSGVKGSISSIAELDKDIRATLTPRHAVNSTGDQFMLKRY